MSNSTEGQFKCMCDEVACPRTLAVMCCQEKVYLGIEDDHRTLGTIILDRETVNKLVALLQTSEGS